MSVEKSPTGKSYAKINSMTPITKYLENNPGILSCDFRHFKAEINDTSKLASFLSQSGVKAIAINKGIPETDKLFLAEAVSARKGALKVQYFA